MRFRSILLVLVGVLFFVGNVKADINDGLVAWYRFEGNAKDSSGNGNDGTEYGGVTYTDGVIGKAASFDGVDDYIDIPDDSSLNLNKSFSISAWVKIKNFNNDETPIVFKGRYNGDANNNQRQYQMVINGNYEMYSNFLTDNGYWQGQDITTDKLNVNRTL